MAYAIGLNSGSSFDGVDAVLIEIDLEDDGHVAAPRYVDGISIDWPEEVGKRVLRAFSNELSVFELTRLNYEAGAVFAQAAKTLLDQHGLTGADIDVIGYDGQTVYQEPPEHDLMATHKDSSPFHEMWTKDGFACGLQIGEPGVVAVLIDAPVVTQFRSVDHTLGGTGAPLMQYLDYVLFRHEGPTATLNIGGISNIQIANPDRSKMSAFDCGPGNIMIDRAMERLFGQPYDKDGATAGRGRVNQEMLAVLLEHPFFSREIPRCAWRLDFGAEYADSMLERFAHLLPEDIIATITAFSAEAIVGSFMEKVDQNAGITRFISSGGGVRNATLMSMIAERLPTGIEFLTSDVVGIPPQFKEAIKFATIAYASKRSIADNIPAASGARGFGILGKHVRAPREAKGITN